MTTMIFEFKVENDLQGAIILEKAMKVFGFVPKFKVLPAEPEVTVCNTQYPHLKIVKGIAV